MSREAKGGRRASTSRSSFWKFISDGKNQRTLAFLGAGLTAVATASWTVITYLGPKGEASAVHSSVSANSITVQGNLFIGPTSDEVRKEVERQLEPIIKRLGPLATPPNAVQLDPSGAQENKGSVPSWTDNGEEPRSERKALIQAIQVHGLQSDETVAAMNKLAVSLVGVGNYTEASELLIRAIQLQRSVNQSSPQLATLLSNYGSILVAAGRYDEAERVVREAIAVTEQTFGSSWAPAAAQWNSLGLIYTAKSSPIDARNAFLRAKQLLAHDPAAAAAQKKVDSNLASLGS